MKRLGLSLILLMILIGLNGCSEKPIDTLQNSLNKYKECMIDNDFKCQVELLDKVAMEKLIDMKIDDNTLIEQLKSSGVKMIDVKMDKPSKIIQNGKLLSSSINYSITANVQGKEMKMNASIKAVSRDNGSTWFFSQGL